MVKVAWFLAMVAIMTLFVSGVSASFFESLKRSIGVSVDTVCLPTNLSTELRVAVWENIPGGSLQVPFRRPAPSAVVSLRGVLNETKIVAETMTRENSSITWEEFVPETEGFSVARFPATVAKGGYVFVEARYDNLTDWAETSFVNLGDPPKNDPPIVNIAHPSRGERIPEGTIVHLVGTGMDPQEGMIRHPFSYKWYIENKDTGCWFSPVRPQVEFEAGPFNISKAQNTSTQEGYYLSIPRGNYTANLTVRDSCRVVGGSSTVNFSVVGSSPTPTPSYYGPCPPHWEETSAPRYGLQTPTPPSPTSFPKPSPTPRQPGFSLPLALLALAGAGLLRRRFEN